MARKCSVDGCERTPGAGWSRCDSHVREWLDRLLGVEWRGLNWPLHPAGTTEPPLTHLEDWAPGELVEAFGK